MIDSKTRNSFISFSILNADTQNAVRELEKKNLCATDKEDENCLTAKLKIEIGDWCGEHIFIISETMMDKKIILGKDFLKLISKK